MDAVRVSPRIDSRQQVAVKARVRYDVDEHLSFIQGVARGARTPRMTIIMDMTTKV
jgi:hypothetical protein